MMDFVLGMDAGGTKTLLATVDRDASVLRLTRHPGLDPTTGAGGPDALRALLRDAGAPVAATLGLPFHGEIVEATGWQRTIVAEAFGATARAVNDVAVAHRGAFAGGEGVLVLAGTGSMAWAVGPRGETRAGGYGDIFGDEGSAYWIGREALAAASRQIDGRAEDSGFAGALCAAIGIAPGDLIDWTYARAAPRAAVAGLARAVAALQAAGDATATAILTRAAQELAVVARAAATRAGLDGPLRWSMAGGVFASACRARRPDRPPRGRAAGAPPAPHRRRPPRRRPARRLAGRRGMDRHTLDQSRYRRGAATRRTFRKGMT